MLKIRLKASNGQYLCAEGGGNREVVANRNSASVWETFTVVDENGGGLLSGDAIYITCDNGKYLCAENGGGSQIVANRDSASVWERFVIAKINDSGLIQNGHKVSMRCSNGQYVCAQNGGGSELVANRTRVGAWETFIIEIEAVKTAPTHFLEGGSVHIQPPANSTFKSFTNRRRMRNLLTSLQNTTPIVNHNENTTHMNRLKSHLAFLNPMGVKSLQDLGTMCFGGNVIPPKGIVSPKLNQLYREEIAFGNAFKRVKNNTTFELEDYSGHAMVLNSHSPGLGGNLAYTGETFLDKGYIFADELHIADDSVIILKNPPRSLIIVANKIIVGDNVTFTWERSPVAIPNYPENVKKRKKISPPEPLGWINEHQTDGRGQNGSHGMNGIGGAIPDTAPSIEIWTLELIGNPAFDLHGQDGGKGGYAQDGQDGQDGAPGKPEEYDWLNIVKSGPGFGGHGGTGGNGGTGGIGGTGGRGGIFRLYAPEKSLLNYFKKFDVTVDGGEGGDGGVAGDEGDGGIGGPVGTHKKPTHRKGGSNGSKGKNGLVGSRGPKGDKGESCCLAIDEDDLKALLENPAIAAFDVYKTKVGATITVTGCRFNPTDSIVVNECSCQITYINDTTLKFTVPVTEGGSKEVSVKRKDGTLSNKMYLTIMPVIQQVTSDTLSQGKLIPGKRVRVIGNGFSKQTRILVKNLPMPNILYIDSQNMEFTLVRPDSITPNAGGEPTSIRMLNPDGCYSDVHGIVLDTFRMMVFGDSIQWGQGLKECDKMHSLVEKAIKQRQGNIGVYKKLSDVRAHSGAVIGKDLTDDGKSYTGEIPHGFPTILSQCNKETENPQSVDFVLMDGGINDVGVLTILNPFKTVAGLKEAIYRCCYEDMLLLLGDVTSKYINARVVVTGYYQMISSKSDTTYLDVFLTAAGLFHGALSGGITAFVLDEVTIRSIITNCRVFAEYSKECLQKAVDEINQTPGHGPVFFAVPPFGEDNAAFANDPWIYGINKDLSPQDDPTVAAARKKAAIEADLDWFNETIAIRASIGHPNIKGAQKYAEEVIKYLEATL